MKAKTNSLVAGALSILAAFLSVMFSATLLVRVLAGRVSGKRDAASSAAALRSEPWTDAQTVKPADLAKEIADAQGADKPVVVCSGVRVLYEGAHVPGAVFHGPASKPEGLGDLKKWAQGIPRSSNVVVYCGCCPFDHCPNIRPAFETLHSMGFQHLRVLVLPNNFAKDWVGQGYPIEKGW
jgi:thiosulfate/3-mercaptopyruvate sulfurtransferase